MRPTLGKHRPALHNLPLCRALSFILSTALVILPVLPAGAAHARAASGARPGAADAARRAAPVALTAAPLASSLSATKVDSYAGQPAPALPGATITYTVTVTNNGPDDATNVLFTDTVDPNTTLVPGSVSTQPIASNDSYNVLGNVRIQPNAAAGLLANDCDPDNVGPCSSAGLTASGPTTSAQGGNVSVNSDGSFSYNPPAGYEGADSFTYTVTDPSGKTDTATANFTVNEVVWFVDNTAAGGDGRLTSPYNSLAPLNGTDLDEPSDFIFVHEGAGVYDGGIVLENDQKLIGQGTGLDAALAAFGVTAPPHSDARPAATSRPVLGNTGGNVITLADGNSVLQLNAAATAAGSAAIFGSAAAGATSVSNVGASAGAAGGGVSLLNHAGTFSMSNGSVTGISTGTAVLISGGSTAISFANTPVSQSGGGRVVDIQSRSGGGVTFDTASSVTGTNGTTDAVSLLGNAGVVTFAGPVQLNTISARGLVADSGTVNMTNAGNAVSATGGAAVDIENLTANLNFATTFSTSSTGRGLRVDNVSGAASFGNTAVNVSGNTGVLLTGNAASLTFSDLDIAPAAGVRALHAVSNSGVLTSASGVVSTTGAGVAVEITGVSSASRSPLNVQLTSVSASGAPSGIVLANTSAAGSPGGFRVTGAGGNCTTADPTCTGGIIQGSTGHGVDLNTADNVALNSIRVTTSADSGVNGSAVNGFALNNALVTANGNSALTDDSGVKLTGVTGTTSGGSNPTSITNSTVSNNFEFQIQLANSAGTLTDLQMSGNAISGNGAGAVGNLFNFLGSGTATMKLSLTGGTFTGNAPSTGTAVNCDSGVSATVSCNVSGATFINNNVAVTASQSGGGNLSFDVNGNTATGTRSQVFNFAATSTSTGAGNGQFVNNTVGAVGVTNSGSTTGIGIRIQNDSTNVGAPPANVLVSGNTVQEIATAVAVSVIQGTRSTNVTIINNTLRRINGNRAILFQHTNGTSCADISGNEMNNVAGSAGDGTKMRIRRVTSGTLNVRQKLATAAADPLELDDANSPPNGVATTTTTPAQILSEGTPTYGGSACTQPTLSSLSLPGEGDATQQLLAAADTSSSPQGAQQGGSAQNRELLHSLNKVRRGMANAEQYQALSFGSVTGYAQPEPLKAAPAAVAAFAGETISVPIGTLKAGDSVTITFQVTIADPFTGSQPQVSNQGTVTADGSISVLTDDPSEAGAADPTVTPLLLPPTINVNDATAAEPATGSANMSFTVTLSNQYPQPVTVNFQTANGGANPATAGTDYTTTSGTVTFAANETVQTVSVPVLADGTPAEGDEHFLVNLSGASDGVIGDGSATGTITDESVASPVIISELRTSGPNGSNDDFVELLNTTDADITVGPSDWSIVKSGTDCSTTPVVVGVVPNGTVIPARGNYLLVGTGYSLGAYAAGNATLSADIEDDHNVGLFTVANIADISSVNRYDAVGFGANTGNNCDLLREGTNLPAAAGSTEEYSFVRKVEKGLTQDTTDNAADFVLVSTGGAVIGGGPSTLGAPGPESSTKPRGPVPCAAPAGSAHFGRDLLDPSVAGGSAPNTVRDNTPVPNGTLGTLEFRRAFTNNTGSNVTALRFRVVDLSTNPAAAGEADLRALSSGAAVVSTTGGPVTVNGTTLEQPPAQGSGGGVNSSLSAGTVTLATPLAAGATVNLRFAFGVQQAGDYDIAFVLEALPGTGKDIWNLSGNTEGGHNDGGCNKPPVANAGADITAECEGGEASVTLDGSGSTDPDGDTPLGYEWKEGATVLGTTQTLNVTLPTGSHTITLTVSDPSGDSSQDTVLVSIVDTQAPEVTAPGDVTAYTGPGATSCGANVSALGTATAEDDCEGSVAVTATRSDNQPLSAPYPVGITVITYSATDGAGHTGTDTQNVTVIDNTVPTVTAPDDITTPADPNSCSAMVNPGTATASDNCSVQSVNGTRSDSQPLSAPYPVGTTTITWTATDVSGNTASDTQTVTVQDAQAPSLSSSVAVTTMGPPFNHALINVGLAATASDNCSFLGPFQVFVYSDEDDGAAPHSPDAANIGIGSLRLRRERDGGSNGRVYLVVVKVADASGNTSTSCSTVTVPLGNSAGDQSSVNAQAAAASTFCSANNGAAPAGYFVVGP